MRSLLLPGRGDLIFLRRREAMRPKTVTLSGQHCRRARSIPSILALFATVLSAGPLAAQTVDSDLWGTGPGTAIGAVARLGNTIFISGGFASVGPCTGGG